MARRLLSPDSSIRQTEVRDLSGATRTYNAHSGGIVTVSDKDARSLLAEGYTEPSAAGTYARRVGRRCTGCGFASFFTTCSRCGGSCEKE